MKISDVFKKRALFGVAIFCITAIATVGAFSIGGNEEDDTPDSLVDLNGSEDGWQNADNTGENGQMGSTEGQQTAENPGETGDITDPIQTAENPGVEDPTQTAQQPGVEDPAQTAENPGVEDPTQTAQQPVVEDPSQVAEGEKTEEPEQTEVLSPQLIAEQLNFDKAAGLLWPISGDVVIPYSPEHGVYHKTLEQFSTSEAMVLASTVGTEVKAAAKGVVTSIEDHYRTGTTVTLALGNNTNLVYGQLELGDLKEGDVVEAGECLGTVAEPTKYYVVEGPNLYFQVLEGDVSIDPASLLQGE